MSRARDIANLINVAPSIYATDDEAVLKALVDAKGDLITGTADNAVGRLAVGTDGHLLSAASGEAAGMEWVAPPEGGLVHINNTSFSAVPSQSFNNVFSADYKNYKVIIFGSSSVGTTFSMRYRTAGSDNTTSNYDTQRNSIAGTTSTSFRNLAADVLPLSLGNEGAWTFFIDISNPFETLSTFAFSLMTAGVGNETSGSRFSATTSFDGFTFFPASGTITGTMSIWGYKS